MKKFLTITLMAVLVVGCGSKQEAQTTETAQPSSAPAMEQAASPKVSSDANEAKKIALLKEGADLLNKGDVPEAIKVLVTMIKIDPRDPRGYLVLSETYIRMQRYDEATQVADALIKNDPSNGMAYYLKGMALGFQRKLPEAIAMAEKSMDVFKEKRDKGSFEKAAALMQGLRQLQDEQPTNKESAVKAQDIMSAQPVTDQK